MPVEDDEDLGGDETRVHEPWDVDDQRPLAWAGDGDRAVAPADLLCEDRQDKSECQFQASVRGLSTWRMP